MFPKEARNIYSNYTHANCHCDQPFGSLFLAAIIIATDVPHSMGNYYGIFDGASNCLCRS
jgi:hypothetical protein